VAQAHHAVRLRRHALAAPGVEAQVVVIAERGDERRAREAGHDVESDAVAPEGERPVDVPHVQVQVPHREVGRGLGARLLVRDRVEQVLQVERQGTADRGGVAQVAPALARAVRRQLDPVPVRVGQVDRLGDVVV
jgi:hypothetical protein